MGNTVIDAGARGNRCRWGLVVVVVVIVIVRPYQREEIKKAYLSVVTCFILVCDLYGWVAGFIGDRE